MKFSIVKVYNEGGKIPTHGFNDVTSPLSNSLRRLGHTVDFIDNELNKDSVNIVFNAHHFHPCLNGLKKDDIIFNLEQYHENTAHYFDENYITVMQHCRTLDYSKRNLKFLQSNHNIQAEFFRLGYDPDQTVIDSVYPQDFDVFFYGTINRRRAQIINELYKENISVAVIPSCYGQDRDYYIARARCVLNVHYYESASLEIVRLGYLFSNKKAVVSELAPKTYMYPELKEACSFAEHHTIVAAIQELLADDKKRQEQAEKGFEAFKEWPMDKSVEQAFGKAIYVVAEKLVPTHINAGSGKIFKEECLNIDINPIWTPDILLNLSQPLDITTFSTVRFGEIQLSKNYFEKIYAHDVLEHVPDCIQTMTNFLELLKEGGELHVKVPYDLSYGAWQDPTHIRAFNEKSWLYYTTWCWYTGWEHWTFDLVSCLFHKFGENTTPGNLDDMSLACRSPRVIDSMEVLLKKRRTTELERLEYAKYHRSMYIKK